MLRAESLGFSYPNASQLFAGVNFQIERGESVAIVGRNGAGKTTLFRLLNGLRRPTEGRVLVNGEDTKDVPANVLARTIGSVFQFPETQIFESRVRDEVAFGPRQAGLSRAEAGQRAEEAMERSGLTEYAGTHPLDLDRASRRFVALASVLSTRPQALLLDEPQQGLDFPSVKLLETILQDEKKAGVTVVFISHDMDFVARNAERVLVLGEGGVMVEGPTLRVLANTDLVRRAGLEVPAPLTISQALGLPQTLTPGDLAAAWIQRIKTGN